MMEKWNVSSKSFPDEDLVVSPHCHDEVGSFDQLSGELPLDVTGRISAFLA